MGYLTTLTMYNDRIHDYKENPQKLVDDLFEGKNRANDTRTRTRIGSLIVQPSYHADEKQLYLHSGNTVININPYSQDFKDLLKNNPTLAEDLINRAESLIDDAKDAIKQRQKA